MEREGAQGYFPYFRPLLRAPGSKERMILTMSSLRDELKTKVPARKKKVGSNEE